MLKANSPGARERTARAALVVAAAVAFALLRAPYLSIPLERDEGEYAYIAQRALHGDVPYRDAFDQKPPGIFLAYLGAFALLGQSIEAIHIFLYVWTAATAGVLFVLVRRLAGGLAGVFALLVLSMATADPRIVATAANTEIFMLLPVVASTYCMVRGLAGGRAWWWLVCGVLAAVACWFKQVAAANALFIVAFVAADLWSRRARSPRLSASRIYLLLAAGAVAASAPVILYFAAMGAFGPFVDSVFLHNLEYARRLPASDGLRYLWLALQRQAPSFWAFWLLAGWAILAPRLSGRPRWVWGLLVGWSLASFAGLSFGFYFRDHYFVQMLPPLAALCGVSLSAAGRWLLARPSRARSWAGLVALLLLVVVPPVHANREYLLAGSPAAVSRRIYGVNPFPESLRIADYIRRTSAPDDSVYIVGSEPQILFYAERRSATRYIFFYPLTARYASARDRQREVMEQVAASRPLYVVWSNLHTSLLVGPETERYLFHATRDMLDREYRLEFIARPASGHLEFEFVYGVRARRLLSEAQERGEEIPWVAVFRRAARTPDRASGPRASIRSGVDRFAPSWQKR